MRIKAFGTVAAAAGAGDRRRFRTHSAGDGALLPAERGGASRTDHARHAEQAGQTERPGHAGEAGRADEGLASALSSLLKTIARPAILKADDLPRLTPRTESCIYSCLATLLRDWPPGEARLLISISAQDGRLGIILFDPETSDFSHIATATGWATVATQIAALKGTLASSPNFGGLVITIDVPTTEP